MGINLGPNSYWIGTLFLGERVSVLEFQLFRLKVYPPKQGRLFAENKSRTEILIDAIKGLPEAELRKGIIWHLGNLEFLDCCGCYFRLGRNAKSNIEVYEDGNFIEEEFSIAPYTHVILDAEIEICAIAKKPRLALTASGIAKKFMRLLNESQKSTGVEFEAGEISDPKDFVAYLKQSFSISQFWITFSRPNPIDQDEMYMKPFEKLLEEANGRKGKAELKGEDLQHSTIERLTKSAAKTGDDAGAVFKNAERGPNIRKRLRGNPVTIKAEEPSDVKGINRLLKKIREEYHGIR